MNKKQIFVVMGISLMVGLGLVLRGEQKAEESHHSFITRAGDEIVSAYVNGVDVTAEYKQMEERTKESVADFLNRECSDIVFRDYCMLEMDGMTIEVVVEDVDYTFTFNIEGELLQVSRSDGKKLRG